MQIEPFGVVVVLIGAAALVLHYRWTIYFGFAFTVFGAAAAISLPALGGASITPPHLFSCFIILKALMQRNGIDSFVRSLSLQNPGGWFAAIVLYGIFVSYAAPKLFPGVLVYAFGRLENGVTIRLEPLHYGGGQITQSLYAIEAVLLVVAAASLFSLPRAGEYVFRGFLLCSALNIIFAVVDVISFVTGAELLAFIRTASYAGLYSDVQSGLKRIVGSFTEASAFAGFSCVLLGFWTSLWMQKFRPVLSGTVALCTLTAMMLSTSSTAYVSIAALLMAFIGRDLLSAAAGRPTQRLGVVIVLVPLLVFVALCVIAASPRLVAAINDIINGAVINKLNSESGLERFAWNAQAWQDALDTYLVGVGIGGARASSYIFVLLSNVGLFGTVLFAIFVYKCFSPAWRRPISGDELIIRRACRWALIANLISISVSAGVFEPGVPFYLTAAASAAIGLGEVTATRRRGRAAHLRPGRDGHSVPARQ